MKVQVTIDFKENCTSCEFLKNEPIDTDRGDCEEHLCTCEYVELDCPGLDSILRRIQVGLIGKTAIIETYNVLD